MSCDSCKKIQDRLDRALAALSKQHARRNLSAGAFSWEVNRNKAEYREVLDYIMNGQATINDRI